jgi:methylaspartate mutase sigma subunit
MMHRKNRLIIGVIGNDIHVVANRIMARGLHLAGYAVCNLGVNTPVDDFIMAAIEFEADAVIVSSLNGEGEGWLKGLRQSFNAAKLGDTLLYVGGNLAVGDYSSEEIECRYRKFGFDRVYHRPSSLDVLLDDLSLDLVNGS